MAVKELYKSRRVDGQQTTRQYIITGVTSEIAARAAMFADASCPAVIAVPNAAGVLVNYIRDDASCGVEEDHTESASDGGAITRAFYVGGATWKNPQGGQQQEGSFRLSFDISGQTHRTMYSRETIHDYTAPQAVPRNFKQAINVQEDDTIEGVDFLVPYFTYVLTRTFSNATIQGGWVHNAARIVGSVNDGGYHGFAKGELLLTRVSGEQRADGAWDVTFAFAVSYNETNLTIGDITGIEKDGWDYLWVYFGKGEDQVNHVTHRMPENAYVERIYRRTAYGTLGI